MVTVRRHALASAALLLIASVLYASPSTAQPIAVRGYLDVGSPSGDGPLVLVGDRDGFTFLSDLNFRDWLVGPNDCNGDPNACAPGRTLRLNASANSEQGIVTYQGHTYSRLGGIDSPAAVSLQFDGFATLPAIAPTATVSTSFTFSGTFTYNLPDGSSASISLTGQGLATVFLHSPASPGFPDSWHVDRVLYQFDQAPIPGRWTYADVGDVGQAGSSHFSNGQFIVNAGGGDIWGNDDSFHYLFSSLDHGQSVAARVDSLSAAHPFAKAGVMLRGSLDPSSAHVILDVKPDGGIELMTRSTDGGSTTFIAGATTTFPVWLRLSASGGTAVGLMSSDGVSWTTVGSTPFSGGNLGGLAVTNHDRSTLSQATFEEPSVGLDWPWYQQDVGAVGLAGASEFVHQAYLVSGSGADIWGTTDAFQFLYSAHFLNGFIVARIDSETDTNPFAKAGVMIRGSSDPGSAHAILDVRPNGAVEFMARTADGGATTYLGGATRAFPIWLKLEKHGDTMTGSTSADGSAWTPVGSIDVPVGFESHAGVAVTSHDTSLVNTARIGTLFVQAGSGDTSTPPPDAPKNVVIYANDIQTDAIHGVWAKAGDASAAAGVMLTTPTGSAPNTSAPLASPSDYVDIPFATATNTPYTLWIRVRAAGNSKFSDSLWVQFSDAQANGAGAFPIGTSSGLLVNLATDSAAASVQNWGWIDGAYWMTQPATFTFSTTQHTLRLQPREYGVQIDQIVLSPSTYLNPNASCPTSCGSAPGPVTNDTTIVPKP